MGGHKQSHIGISCHDKEQRRCRVRGLVSGQSCPHKSLQRREYSSANYLQHHMLLVPGRGAYFHRVKEQVQDDRHEVQ